MVFTLPSILVFSLFSLFVSPIFDFVSPGDQVSRFEIEDLLFDQAMEGIKNFLIVQNPNHDPIMMIYAHGHRISYDAGLINRFQFTNGAALFLKSQVATVAAEIQRSHLRKVFGAIPEELHDSLLSMGFVQKAVFQIDDPKLSVMRMGSLVLWER